MLRKTQARTRGTAGQASSGTDAQGPCFAEQDTATQWRAQPALRGDFEQAAGFFVAGGAAAVVVFAIVVAVGAGGHARQADELPPAESRANRAKFLFDRVEVLLAMQAAVLTDRVLEHPVEDGLGRVPAFAVDGDGCCGTALIVVANGVFGFVKQAGRVLALIQLR